MPDVKVFGASYVIETLKTADLEKAVGGAKAKTSLEYAKLQVDHLAKMADASVKQVMDNNKDDFKSGAKSLIVFMAPEFYFKDRSGAPYASSIMIELMEYMKTKMPAKGPNVMILPGTIWWWTSTNKNPLDFTTTKPVIHNTLPILVDKKYVHTWQKEQLSPIDGLVDNCQQWDRDNKAVAAVLDKTQVPVFEHDVGGVKLKIGVEICLDHAPGYQVLKKKAPKDLDIHILIACGMPVVPESFAMRNGGCFFRCDGSIGGTAYDSGVDYAKWAGAKWEYPPKKGVMVGGGGKVFVTDGLTISK